ncbi:MAG TPA: hypothetical protein PLJ27_15265 [Polyangiaceae bacterium]|jgi:hypothetical protein|nr:MAG: hypothetical protein BWY17_03331 [Deltaproteobacteria bacterium ADurb.Bin207]HNS96913.1 hypothetical protein [Polyangiaceae bacterium]HNZ21067.1 hypothetical protein [Polyangiaceae bacterium]HOD22308.1 hypothetical protein [Polyangiaceae bacterium]HOE47837.1 hypothetical protein [Polyangiaceae bacterium]
MIDISAQEPWTCVLGYFRRIVGVALFLLCGSCVSLGLMVALGSSHAVAAPTAQDETKARQLFNEGVEALNRGQFTEALDKFEQAYGLWNNPKILLNIATTLRELDRLIEAAQAYEAYFENPNADRSRIPEVQNVLSEIDKKIVSLTVEVRTEGSTLRVDGAPIEHRTSDAPGKWFVRLMPGEHILVISKEGFVSQTEKFSAHAGEKVTFRVRLEPEEVQPTAMEQPELEDTEDDGLFSHAGQFGLVARVDVDGKLRGAVGVVGVTYGLGDWFEGQVAALNGRDKGFEVDVSWLMTRGRFKPVVSIGIPTFFVDSGRVGIHGAVGLQVDPSRHWGVLAQVGGASFFNAPDNRESFAFVPALGVQGRF